MKLASSRQSLLLHIIFAVILVINTAFWLHSRRIKTAWDNVPPPPSASSAAFAMLGDHGAAYRMFAYSLQNLGNTGGRFEALKTYDYSKLSQWFFVARDLDLRSNYVPFLAAYYFGAVDDEPERVSHVSDYLAVVGDDPYPQKWRWLAQAVYLARYKEKNMEKALRLANDLATKPGNLPPWARQMPAFVHMQMGNKQASYEIMMRMLATEGEKLHPNEVNAIKAYICEQALSKADAAKNPLCQT